MKIAAKYISVVGLVLVLWCASSAEVMGQYFSFGKNKVQYNKQDWRHLQTENFSLYYYGDGKPLAVFAARAAEETFARLSGSLSGIDDARIAILVYQGHHRFSNTNAVDLPDFAEGIGGVTEMFKNRIAVPFMGSYREFEQVIKHEVVHAVVNEAFYGGTVQSMLRNNIRLRLPLWFEEGLAENVSLGWSSEADMYVREALLDNRLSSPRNLRGFMAYKGGQSFWDYVEAQYGSQAVDQILASLQMRRSVDKSIEETTGLSFAALSDRWQQSLREIYYPEIPVRQEMTDVASPIVTRSDGAYHTSPVISPQGNRVAYVSARGALYDVFVAAAQSGETLHRLVEGQTSAMFESLRLHTPGLAWSPDGLRLAVAVTSGPTEAVAVIHVETGLRELYRLQTLDQVNSLSWSPSGEYIALDAAAGSQGDIYVLHLPTHNLENITDDVFSDHQPSWHPDGDRLVFHSDRGDNLTLRTHTAARVAIATRQSPSYDLYEIHLEDDEAVRFTQLDYADNKSGKYGPEGDQLLFISDRNGIDNLYRLHIETGRERVITDLMHGVMQFSVSSDGERATLLGLETGAPSVYFMRQPFRERVDRLELRPTVWAQRSGPTTNDSPAMAVASTERRGRNPFLRAAEAGQTYTDTVVEATAPSDAEYGSVQIDFNDGTRHVPSGRAEEDGPPLEILEDESDDVEDFPYRLSFSPDLIYGATGFDALYGVQGLVQMRFSDMMGNHRLNISTNLLLDLRNADYSFSYQYLARRIDWSFTGYHTARLLPDYQVRTYHRFRRYGASLRATYPFDKFHRIEFDAGIMGASQADIGDPSAPLRSRVLPTPAVTFTRDVTSPGYLVPASGHRFALHVSGGWGDEGFASVLADARQYVRFDKEGRYTFALRGAGGTSFGDLRQLYFASGVQNWLNRSFDAAENLPITSASDFMFASPVLPMRGHGFNARSGAHFGMVNAELRIPLTGVLGGWLSSYLPIQNMTGTAFTDAAAIWDGREYGDRLRIFQENELGQRVFDDLLMGMGVGVRSLVLGYPIRLDVAWPFDGRYYGEPQWYLSVGVDF